MRAQIKRACSTRLTYSRADMHGRGSLAAELKCTADIMYPAAAAPVAKRLVVRFNDCPVIVLSAISIQQV